MAGGATPGPLHQPRFWSPGWRAPARCARKMRPRCRRTGSTNFSMASIQRRAHQFLLNEPRWLRALMPRLVWIGLDGAWRGWDSVRSRCSLIFFFGEAYFLLFPPQLDQIAQIFGAQFGQPAFTAANDGFDQALFCFRSSRRSFLPACPR